MKELTSQSLAPIRDVIQGQNYAFIKARLNQLLPLEVAESFAKISIQGNEGIWYAEKNLNYHPYSEAGEIEKEEIAIRIESIKESASRILKEAMPYWESLFTVPSIDSIFWAKGNGEAMEVVIAEWGFENRSIATQTDVISELITAPRSLTQIPVVLHCSYSNGDPVSDYDFRLLIFNNVRECKSAEDGSYTIGSLFPGKDFAVEDAGGGQRQTFKAAKDASYEVVFNLLTGYRITVVNQNQDPISGYDLEINGVHHITDENGVVQMDGMVLMKDAALNVAHEGITIGNFNLSKNPEDNEFVIKVEQKIVKPKTVTIRLRGYKGEILPELPFKITTDKGKIIEGKTDNEGNAVFNADDFTATKKYRISFNLSSEYQKQRYMAKEGKK